MATAANLRYYLAVTIDGKPVIERFRTKRDAFSRAAVLRVNGHLPTVHEWPKGNNR